MAVNRSLASGTPPWVIAGYGAALVLVFLGERVFSTLGWLREGLTGLGIVALLALTALRWMAVRATDGERRTVERALAILSTLGAFAVFVYLTTAEPFDDKLGLTRLATDTRHRYDAVATVTWIALLLCSFLPTLFAERALFPMRRAARIEWRRVRDALAGGLGLGLAAVYGTLFAFVAGELDVKADFSYFRTARPGESTRNIAASATEPIKVLAFFPQVNEVGTDVATYLRDLGKSAPKLDVEVYDRLLVPQIAKDAKVSDDGVVVLERGGQRETLTIGTDAQKARPKLKTLDQDFQKSLMKVLRPKRTAYFTTGHGELTDAQPTPLNEGRSGKGIRGILEQQNYVVRDLSAASGLGVDVPDDATITFVLGPSHALLPEEVQALQRYLDRGGKLFLCLDPDALAAPPSVPGGAKVDLASLADLVGLTVSTSVLANDKVHLRRRFNDSDRVILATNRYSSHASVSTLSRTSRPVVFLGAAALDKKAGADGALKYDFAVRAMADTFDDQNGNFKFDGPAEKRQSYGLAVAVSKEPMRAFVLGDVDAVSDAALTNEGNVLLVADAVRWLGGEESFAGTVNTGEDVPIEHTKQKELIWFYGTIFGAPALVLAAGLLYTRRVTRSRKGRGAPAQEKLA